MHQGWILTVTPFLRVKMPTAEKDFFRRTMHSADLNKGKAKKFKNLQMDFPEWNKGSDRDTTLDKLNE